MDLSLLKTMCAIHSPSGNEVAMKEFILDYIKKESKNWKNKPKVIHGKGFQDNIILVFVLSFLFKIVFILRLVV